MVFLNKRKLRVVLQGMALLVLGVWLNVACATSEYVEGEVVQDLYYGEALFQYFNRQHFDAIVHMLAAEKAERLPNHMDQAQLLRGGIYVAYGQHADAEAVFTELLSDDTQPADVRARAWFYLGKLQYQRGEYGAATSSFLNSYEADSTYHAQERAMLDAQTLLAQKQYQQASEFLEAWQAESEWKYYSEYNLGIALLLQNDIEAGRHWLQHVGMAKPPKPSQLQGAYKEVTHNEFQVLSDKANVALAYTYLQTDEPKRAQHVLMRVGANSPFSLQARLGEGWAEAELGRFEQALGAWTALSTQDPLSPAVQESLLAVPYALNQLGQGEAAVQAYEQGVAVLEQEIAHLSDIQQMIEAGDWIQNMLLADRMQTQTSAQGEMSWFRGFDQLPEDKTTRYVYRFLAEHRFQESFKNLRDLDFLLRNVQDWQKKLLAFQTMVDTREARFAQFWPQTQQALGNISQAQWQAQLQAQTTALAQTEQNNQVLALVSPAEQQAFSTLNALLPKVMALPETPRYQLLKQRARILNGLVLWQANHAYPARLWQAQKALKSFSDELDKLAQMSDTLRALPGQNQQQFTAYGQQLAAKAATLATLEQQIKQVFAKQSQVLNQLVVNDLAVRGQRLGDYVSQMHYALATVYDAEAAAFGVTP